MRNEHVFAAMDKVLNRYMLCTLTSKTMRITAKPQVASSKVINDVLAMIGDGSVTEPVTAVVNTKAKTKKVA